MRGYRHSLTNIPEVSEPPETDSEAACPYTHYNATPQSGAANQFDGEDSGHEATRGVTGQENGYASVTSTDTWSQRRLMMGYARLVPFYCNEVPGRA